jgi:hypothetical protein
MNMIRINDVLFPAQIDDLGETLQMVVPVAEWTEDMASALVVGTSYEIERLDNVSGDPVIIHHDRALLNVTEADGEMVAAFQNPEVHNDEPSSDAERIKALEDKLAAYEAAYNEGVQNA